MSCDRGLYCVACDRHFRSLQSFDGHIEHHHQEDGACRCRTDEELRERRMAPDDEGFWLDPSGVAARLTSRRGGSRKGRSVPADSPGTAVGGAV